MKIQELKKLIQEELKKVLKENQPAVAPKPGTKEPGTKEPGTKEKPKTPFQPKPGVKPRPKQQGKMNENEQEIVKKIVGRFRQEKK
jgi:hypothetical protein